MDQEPALRRTSPATDGGWKPWAVGAFRARLRGGWEGVSTTNSSGAGETLPVSPREPPANGTELGTAIAQSSNRPKQCDQPTSNVPDWHLSWCALLSNGAPDERTMRRSHHRRRSLWALACRPFARGRYRLPDFR